MQEINSGCFFLNTVYTIVLEILNFTLVTVGP